MALKRYTGLWELAMTWSTKCKAASINTIENKSRGIRAMSMGSVRLTRAKNGPKNRYASTKAVSSPPNSRPRRVLKGALTLNSIIKPVIAVVITAMVEASALVRPRGSVSVHKTTMLAVMVKAAGMHIRITLKINLPFTRSLLGSRAQIKEGTPMVRELIRGCCMG